MQKFNYLKISNADYIEALFQKYQQNPDSIDPTWRYFFEGFEFADSTGKQEPLSNGPATSETFQQETKVIALIQAYREKGHLIAQTNPLQTAPQTHPDLDLIRFGLNQSDLDKTFVAGQSLGIGPQKLSAIIQKLKEIYCGTIGIELAQIQNANERQWLQNKLESQTPAKNFEPSTKKFILERITKSETFEKFIHTRYVAQKRFSIEGGESTIVALDCMIETGAELGVTDVVMGMAHRGRLNVLTHIMGKSPEYIFTEFEGLFKYNPEVGEGDVKYHMGYSADFTTRLNKKVHLSIASNPSHLEFINPVVLGIARAKQTFLNDTNRSKVLPILIHGDAAFAGQGVCYESLNLSQLEGYSTGGTLHIVINNQVGFTANPRDCRSTLYSTDLAKMLDAPIFHINGDDPEAVWYISKIISEYRALFKKDAFIDLVCYRKHGHNEGDEPSFTQPLLYKKIKTHPTVREVYAQRLIQQQVVSEQNAQQLVDQCNGIYSEAQAKTKSQAPQPHVSVFEGRWKGLKKAVDADLFKTVTTAVPEIVLKDIASKINQVPSDFHLHSKLERFFQMRQKAVMDGHGIDWGNAETLAYASLLIEGHSVRLSGQDAKRGTFTHRHAALFDFETEKQYIPMNYIKEGQAKLEVYSSHLSETGVMGFEYGYSLADPLSLVIWEAQFGDFANGAQVIIDQFISSSESKWQRMNGLVLLLPHGFEGQGPEHSSARLERFLQLCGRANMSVCNFTTPAQIFHALRRQLKRDFRKPLVVMSPKSLLRHPEAISSLQELTHGIFNEALDDALFKTPEEASSVKKLLLCSGKIYYDLNAYRTQAQKKDVAIIRIEQLYPWPAMRLLEILKRYPQAKEICWVQEEPKNMGAWTHVQGMWDRSSAPLHYIGRGIGASPAVGYLKVHEAEQKALIEKAFT